MRFSQVAFSIALVAAVSAGPISEDYRQRRGAAPFALKNGQDAGARIANTGPTGGLLGKREIVVRYVSFAL